MEVYEIQSKPVVWITFLAAVIEQQQIFDAQYIRNLSQIPETFYPVLHRLIIANARTSLTWNFSNATRPKWKNIWLVFATATTAVACKSGFDGMFFIFGKLFRRRSSTPFGGIGLCRRIRQRQSGMRLGYCFYSWNVMLSEPKFACNN